MKWLKRSALVVAGALGATMFFWLHGTLVVGGDFIANVAGAAIGGAVSVGLAVMMFQHERKVASKDATTLAASQRADAIREATRYIRAIRECVKAAGASTIGTRLRLTVSIFQAAGLTQRALREWSLTDFPLRLAMEDAATIATRVALLLDSNANGSINKSDDTPVPGATVACATAVASLDELISDYTALRIAPLTT